MRSAIDRGRGHRKKLEGRIRTFAGEGTNKNKRYLCSCTVVYAVGEYSTPTIGSRYRDIYLSTLHIPSPLSPHIPSTRDSALKRSDLSHDKTLAPEAGSLAHVQTTFYGSEKAGATHPRLGTLAEQMSSVQSGVDLKEDAWPRITR